MEFYVRDWAAWRDGRSDGGFLQDPRRSLWDSWPLFVLVELRKCSLNFCEGNGGIGARERGLLIHFFFCVCCFRAGLYGGLSLLF